MKIQNKETRYFIDVDIKTMKIIKWEYDQRVDLVKYKPKKDSYRRIYLTKGQYNKFSKSCS